MASSCLTTITGHTGSVWTSSFSHDRSCLATCSSDETSRVWSTQQLDSSSCPPEVARLFHKGVVRGCGFSPDSSLLATCSWDKRILLHSTSDFKVVSELLGHRYGVSHVQFSPCGGMLVSCSWDDSIGVWDVQTSTLLHWLVGHCSPVSSCTFLPATLNGALVMASCSWDGTVKMWDMSRSHEALFTLQYHPEAVYDVSSSPTNTDLLASCGRRGSIIIWDLRATMPWQVLQDGWIEFNCVSFTPNGDQVFVGDSMGQIRTWDLSALKVSDYLRLDTKVWFTI